MSNTSTIPNGRFGHHPDPAIDFEVEVDALTAINTDRKLGFYNPEGDSLTRRVERAMQFRVGGVPSCVSAKGNLRRIEASLMPSNSQSTI
jgi:hypothetical protein